MIRSAGPILLLLTLAPLAAGCFLFKSPDKANIALRKQNQQQQDRIAELERKAAGDDAMIRSLQTQRGTLPTLPLDRLQKLFTTHDIKLLRLTGGADLDVSKPGQEGLKVYVAPLDETGDPIKSAGTFTVEAFDLSHDPPAKIGTWTFDSAATRQAWTSVLNRYNYVLTCPWQQTRPGGPDVHLDVMFTDELTQAQFKQTADVKVDVHPSTPPTSQPTRPSATAGN